MRRLVLVILLAACSRNQPTNPATLGVEDTALWFMRAALAGDEVTARTLVLSWHDFAQFSARDATAEREAEWNATTAAILEQLGKEGDEGEVVAAKVVDRRTLDPRTDSKVNRRIDVAIVRYEVRERDGRRRASPMPWLFIKTEQGWKYSPKK